jgi:hypothetical protein
MLFPPVINKKPPVWGLSLNRIEGLVYPSSPPSAAGSSITRSKGKTTIMRLKEGIRFVFTMRWSFYQVNLLQLIGAVISHLF